MEILIGVLWLLEAALVGYVADQRGRSSTSLFMLALVMGPLAFVVALALPVKPWALPLRENESRYCRFCQSRISARATACPCCSQVNPHAVEVDSVAGLSTGSEPANRA